MLRSKAVGSNVIRVPSREARRRDRNGVLDLFIPVARNLRLDISRLFFFPHNDLQASRVPQQYTDLRT
jgi:hypothetical protein